MATLIIHPGGEQIELDENLSLMENLTAQNFFIKATCGGFACCGDCKIKILSGEDYLSSPSFEEIKILGNVFHLTKERLSCQVKLRPEMKESVQIKIDLSEHDQDSPLLEKKALKKTKLRKAGTSDDEESLIEAEEKEEAAKKDEVSWFKHWEKDPEEKTKKKGGGRRPRFFAIKEDEYRSDEFKDKFAKGEEADLLDDEGKEIRPKSEEEDS